MATLIRRRQRLSASGVEAEEEKIARMAAIRLFAVYVVIAVAACLGVPGVDGNIMFSTEGATEDKYSQFVKDLRADLTTGQSKVHDIPVLSANKRFILVDLSSSKNTVTVAINAVNVYMVGFCACQDSPKRAYFYKDTSDVDINTLFPGVDKKNKVKLGFGSSYDELERKGKARDQIDLGMEALKQAILGLTTVEKDQKKFDEAVAIASLVVIQMVSEAARFRFIEARVSACLNRQERSKFKPDSAMLELETSWGKLSGAIQESVSVQGVFKSAVQVNGVKVDSVYLFYVKGIALLLKSSSLSSPVPRIVMPVEGDYYKYSSSGYLLLNGVKGLCVEVKNKVVQVLSCGTTTWTLRLVDPKKPQDGVKIELSSSGECLSSGEGNAGSSVTLASKSDCNKKTIAEQLKWTLSIDGTITNNGASKLVLNVNSHVQGSSLSVQTKNGATGQSWRLGINKDPSTTSIRGRQALCLQPKQDDNGVEMKQCIELEEKEKKKQGWEKQQWDLYSDGSIRVKKDSTWCLTANGRSAGSPVEIRVCIVDANQRWLFKNNGLLVNPVSGLALEKKSPVHIIINTASDQNTNQQWLPYF